MRLSNIINKGKSPLKAAELPKAAPPADENVSQPPPQTPPPVPDKPEMNLENIKKEMREDFEKEFREKMAEMDRAKKEFENEIASKEEKMKALGEDLKAEEAEVEAIKKEEREKLQAALEAEKQKVEELHRALESRVEQVKLEERRKKDEALQKALESKGEGAELEAEKRKVEELRRELEAKAGEARLKEEKLKPAEERSGQEEKMDGQISAEEEAAVADVMINETKKRQERYQKIKAQQVTQTQLHLLYDKLFETGSGLLEDIASKREVNFDAFRGEITTMLDMALKYDGILVGISLQPYAGDDFFSYHAANCMILSLAIGIEMKISEDYLTELALASFHDIALADIREDLDYPKELTKTMKKRVTDHPGEGAEIMRAWLGEEAVEGIRCHHETSDGQGYPKKLKQQEIPLFAKIISVVDSFEAMTHTRPYRAKPLPVSEAMKQMIEIGKHSYDKEVLKALMAQVGFYPVMCLVELSNKQIARVIRQNKKHPLSPVVKIEFDEWGHKIRKPVVIDLTESKLIHVVGTLEEVESYQTRLVSRQVEKKSLFVILLVRVLPFFLLIAALGIIAYVVIKI